MTRQVSVALRLGFQSDAFRYTIDLRLPMQSASG
jgi:hypothetical protein